MANGLPPLQKANGQVLFAPYLYENHQQNTDSTGSQESILTQVPTSFHQTQAQDFHSQHSYNCLTAQGEVNTILPFATATATVTATANLNESKTCDRKVQALNNKSLNPNAATFKASGGGQKSIPSTNGSQNYQDGYAMRLALNQRYLQHQQQIATGYPAQFEAGIGGAFGGPNWNFQNQYPTQNVVDQCSDFDRGPPVNEYANMNVGSQGHESSVYSGSASHSYSSVNRHQLMAYDSSASFPSLNYEQMPIYSQVQQFNPYIKQDSRSFQSFQKQQSSGNRAKNFHYCGQKTARGGAPDGYTTAIVSSNRKGNSKSHPKLRHQKKIGSMQQAYDEPTKAPATQSAQTNDSSIAASSESATCASSDSESSIEQFCNGEGDVSNKEIEKSPLATQEVAQIEFFSKKNGTTPTLRCRRNQSISTVNSATDPSLKQVNLTSSCSPADTHSPPKMNFGLLASGGIHVKSLAQINANDPFATRSTLCTPTYALNSFNSAKVTTPFSGTSLLNSPPQSPALYNLVLMGQHKPKIQEVLNNLPFIEYCRTAKEDTFGVIKIKNIPYSVKRPEVLAFLGRNARIISEQEYEPVHIVMERVTSKTLDCYVEFINFNEALNAVNRFDTNRTGGRGGRLGQRHVEVELSSQEALMQDLFPKAKDVQWCGSVPKIKLRDSTDPYNSGFQGFISKEELVMLVKHVEAPQRSPFSKECPQRPFECIISTLYKYPWYMVEHITIEDRQLLHKATMQLLKLLQERLNQEAEDIHLNHMLLRRVWRAGLKCRGFSPSQKDDIAVLIGLPFDQAHEFGLPEFAADWKHLWTIGPRADAPSDLVLWYIAHIREATEIKKPLTLAERSVQDTQQEEAKLFGQLHKHIDYSDRAQFYQCTLAQVATREWTGIEKLLRLAFPEAST